MASPLALTSLTSPMASDAGYDPRLTRTACSDLRAQLRHIPFAA